MRKESGKGGREQNEKRKGERRDGETVRVEGRQWEGQSEKRWRQ